ncbi:hypothetical protein, partial [Lentzea albidocapillata]|uniref:hypothetical protein n=1 Tax=Lentzea albidocapillata TaxID=40571 RepID=UPI001C1F45FD
MNSSLKERVCQSPRAAVFRLAAAVLAGCQDGRCVWAHDFAPAHDTASRDVVCRVVVGVPNEVTP